MATDVEDHVPLNVFLSHAHNDAELAKAVSTLLDDLFDTEVKVVYSSDQSPGGGITGGANWLEWILDQVKSCDVAIVMLTPESLGRPWLMWESGAVSGMALGLEKQGATIPLLYRVNAEEVPAPMRWLQGVQGETESGARRLVDAIWKHVGQRPGLRQLTMLMDHMLPGYLQAVQQALQSRPQALTEDGVQEWCERLDALRLTGRSAEVEHIHRALLLAFAPSGDKAHDVPLALRLHRRLGELYLDAKRGREAVTQFRLALRLFDKDLFVLHKLALAHLEAGDRDQALQTLERIEQLDEQAVTENPEVAGLKGRLHRERWERTGDTVDLRAARDAYRIAMEARPDSYYMAANVGELSLALGEREVASDAYRSAAGIIHGSGERTFWSVATLAAAAIVNNKQNEALEFLREAGSLALSARDIDSVRKGLRRLHDSLSVPAGVLESRLDALSSGSVRDSGEPV